MYFMELLPFIVLNFSAYDLRFSILKLWVDGLLFRQLRDAKANYLLSVVVDSFCVLRIILVIAPTKNFCLYPCYWFSD